MGCRPAQVVAPALLGASRGLGSSGRRTMPHRMLLQNIAKFGMRFLGKRITDTLHVSLSSVPPFRGAPQVAHSVGARPWAELLWSLA